MVVLGAEVPNLVSRADVVNWVVALGLGVMVVY